MSKGINRIYLLLGIILSIYCASSPLSDVEISDPSLISVSAYLYYDEYDNFIKDTIKVIVTDKNGNALSLKVGECYLNDKIMKLNSKGYDIYYYLSYEDLDIRPCSTCILSIMLADSSKYPSNIIAPPIINYRFELPSTYFWGDGTPVKWDTLNNLVNSRLSEILANGKIVTLLDSIAMLKCSYTIPGTAYVDILQIPDSISSILKIIKYGNVINEFRSFEYKSEFIYRAVHKFK